MKELNQKIKEFYEQKYRTSVKTQSNSYYYVDIDDGHSMVFLAFRGNIIKTMVKNAKTNWNFAELVPEDFDRFLDEEIVYFFNKGAHTEEEMLRIIKLKAFI